MRLLQRIELGIRNAFREACCGLLFENKAQLECVVDQFEVHVGDLQAALRHCLDQTFCFKAGNRLADGTEG